MFKFKVGQRVKVIGNSPPLSNGSYRHKVPIGTIVTILECQEYTSSGAKTFNYYETSHKGYELRSQVMEIDLKALTPSFDFYSELTKDLREKYSLEEEIDFIISGIKLDRAIKELTPKDLSLKE